MSLDKRMHYGMQRTVFLPRHPSHILSTVRLGKSGLKVSRIILGTMQYGHPGWAPWVLGEDEAIEHIKFA